MRTNILNINKIFQNQKQFQINRYIAKIQIKLTYLEKTIAEIDLIQNNFELREEEENLVTKTHLYFLKAS